MVAAFIAYKQGLLNSFFGSTPPGTTPPPASGGPLAPGTPFHFSAGGDVKDNGETATNLAANNPEVVLVVGDFSYNGGAQEWWSGTMAPINGLNSIACVGNHDEPEDDFLNLFPLNNGQWEFIHKVSNVAFVAVNTGLCDARCADPSTADPLLAQAEADPEVAHIIVFGHKSVFTPSSNDISPDAPPEYQDVFAKYSKIRMYIAGHNHFYARMNAVGGQGPIHVTVGNGGANAHSDSEEGTTPPAQYVKSNGCLHCDVNNETISCQMISNEGLVWDEFTITPGSPPQSSEDPAQAGSVGSEADNDADQASLARVRRVVMARYGES